VAMRYASWLSRLESSGVPRAAAACTVGPVDMRAGIVWLLGPGLLPAPAPGGARRA